MRMGRVSLVALLVWGCSSSGDGEDPESFIAYTEIAAAYKDASCDYLVRCGQFADKATCIGANLNIEPITLSDQVVASIDAGRIRYNGSNVKKCIDAWAARTCDSTDENGRAPIPECLRITSATVASGGECWADLECVSGNCQGNGESPCRAGVCMGEAPTTQGPKQAGESCSFVGECASGLYCDQQSLKCVTLKTAGAVCNDGNECAYGLGCAGTSMRTCKTLPAVGEPCPDFACRDDGTYCSNEGSCAQVGLVDAMCTSNTQCSAYYQCDFNTSKCIETPRIGQTCTLGGPCFDADAYCDPTALSCMAGRADGDACMYNFQCTSQACTASVCGEIPRTCP
jgi:hypothetical protein